MENMYHIGLGVHKKTISYCVKDGSGRIHAEGTIPATRLGLDMWMKTLPQPWTAAMEATIFTAWIYDHLQSYAAAVKVVHPLMLRAIAAAKKKNDRIDATRSPTACVVIFCRSVTWLRRRFASGGAHCATGTYWSARPCS
jgi:transposase